MMPSIALKHDLLPEVPEFLKDACDFFSQRRSGHMSNWLYAEAAFEGDKAGGANAWVEVIEQAKRDGVYYVFQKERDIIQKFSQDTKKYIKKPTRLIDLGPGSVDAVRSKVLPLILSSAGLIDEYVSVDICKKTLKNAQESIRLETSCVNSETLCKDFVKDRFVYGRSKDQEIAVLFGLTLFNMLIDPRVKDLPEIYLGYVLMRLKLHFSSQDCSLVMTQDINQDIKSLKPAYMAIEKHYKSLLYRISRDLNVVGNYNPEKFVMDVEYFEETQACALSFVATSHMKFWIEGQEFIVSAGDRFYFHNAYKFSVDRFKAVATVVGFEVEASYSEIDNPCVLHVLKVK